jgi:hypothetical protein
MWILSIPIIQRNSDNMQFSVGYLLRQNSWLLVAPEIDDSGNGFDGILNGATWVNDGVLGGVLEFDGICDYVDFPEIDSSAPRHPG